MLLEGAVGDAYGAGILNQDSLRKMLKKSIDFGGDVDTVASLTLAIGKTSKEVENDLPQWLYENLENDHFGHEFLKGLDVKLWDLKT